MGEFLRRAELPVALTASLSRERNAHATYQELEERSEREYIQPSMLLEAAAAVEKLDQAIAFAQKGLDERDPLFVLLARLWPGYNPLRADARFLKIVSQLELPDWNV